MIRAGKRIARLLLVKLNNNLMENEKQLKDYADQYVMQIFVDYGDLNEKAELQIKDAFIAGAIHAEIARYFESNSWRPTMNLRFIPSEDGQDIGVEQEWVNNMGESEWRFAAITNKFPTSY